ncbi:SDR family NAD(P)-dependent oxidoreductase [Streptomyces sp. NPDC091377]|uniref:SDR family NAD(P)-dependent oxidoreductase n=1 Tax=Streptomyces sp. NPDC091377 TaxID=3365995 RepID=UPI0038095393
MFCEVASMNNRVLASANGIHEPIAIVGMACRLPGEVNSPDDLWEVLSEGRDVIGALPTDRGWDLDALYDPDPERVGTFSTHGGGFLHDAAGFDADLFGISPREAMAAHPQQRLLLETAWEACESAGIAPDTLRGSDTSVFTGVFAGEYGPRLHEGGSGTDGYLVTGGFPSVVAGRIAYTLGLHGPAVSVDTACSSSLSAVHMAVQSLRRGECSLTLAGGATVLAAPGLMVEFSKQQILSRDGRSRAFADNAAGMGIAEGATVLMMERLEDARANGHTVLAVIRGSAWNQDGDSETLPTPSQPAQEEVIRLALADAGLRADEIDLIEAHGTGTPVGDPIEARSVLSTYGQRPDTAPPAYLGSVKSNIGHTQGAAGATGLLKTVLAMQHGRIPATLHVENPTTAVDWSAGHVRLAAEPVDWPAGDRPRRAGVLSYGISGTNAHVVVEEAPPPPAGAAMPPPSGAAGTEHGPLPWVLTAANPAALRDQAQRLLDHLAAQPGYSAADVGLSLATTRARLPYRAAVTGNQPSAYEKDLRALAEGKPSARLIGPARALDRPPTAFVFPGQGGQWAGMAAGFLDVVPEFTEQMHACADALAACVDWSPLDVLRGVPGAPEIDRVDVMQPVLFATMVSLAALWRAHGVRPDAVTGHSQGEIAAAFVAGALSLEDAVRIVALRSRALRTLEGHGGMATLRLPWQEATDLLRPWAASLSIAAENGPSSVVVSGAPEPLTELLRLCRSRGIRALRVAARSAGHSSQVDALHDMLWDGLATVRPKRGRIPFFSTVTGTLLETTDLGRDYWFRNLRQSVRFHPVVRSLIEAGHRALIEVSPNPVLTVDMLETVEETGVRAAVLGTLRSDEAGPDGFHRSVAEAHVRGVPVDTERSFATRGARRTVLPTYAFQHRRFWLDAGTDRSTGPGMNDPHHPLLSARVPLDDGGLLFTGRLSTRHLPWLADHALRDTALLPGTAFLELALHAAAALGCDRIGELVLQRPLPLDESPVDLQLTTGPQADGEFPLRISSRAADAETGEPWTQHARGVLHNDGHVPGTPSGSGTPAGPWPPQGAEQIPIEGLYDRLTTRGYHYGPAFRNLRAVWRQGDTLYSEASLDDEQHAEAADFLLHPALADAAFHALLAEGDGPLALPFAWRDIRLHATGPTRIRTQVTHHGPDTVEASVLDQDGSPVVSIGALVLRPAGETVSAPRRGGGLLRMTWNPLAAGDRSARGSWALVGADPRLVDALAGTGATVSVHQDLTAVLDSWAAAGTEPVTALLDLPAPQDAAPASAPTVHHAILHALDAVRTWLLDERSAGGHLVVLTHGAISTAVDEDVHDLTHAGVWGLIRTAQTEQPGRITIVDTDDRDGSLEALPAALTAQEPQLVLREGEPYVPRLADVRTTPSLPTPEGTERWRLDFGSGGTLDSLALVPLPDDQPLGPGQVRVAVRASGVNFRDLLIALDMVPLGTLAAGSDGAGIVTEVAPDVTGFSPGDRVVGMFLGSTAYGTNAVADSRLIAGIPTPDMSFEAAVTLPVAYLTTWYALIDHGRATAGERLLIHAAAGGVGMAAIQLARHLGLEVFATASPAKWDALRALGIDDSHLASSRTSEFEQKFLHTTDGEGVDLVLNSLTGAFIDASLRLLPRGGRFLELGKLDQRAHDDIARGHPGVDYHVVDPQDAGQDRMHDMLTHVLDLVRQGQLHPLPLTRWDIRRAPAAFRYMREARHIGKNVMVPPLPLDPHGTVLITGGTGTLGSLLARHLVHEHGVRHLLLLSRSGPRAPGAEQLGRELDALGAHTTITACDAADEDALRTVIDSVPDDHPLTAVVHTAVELDDAVITRLTHRHVERVLRPKADAALHLHRLTRHLDLSAFVLYSSMAGLLGNGGQAGYAAANTFLDALACHRRAQGLPATSLAWGFWKQRSTTSGRLDDTGIARILAWGTRPFSDQEGLALFDQSARYDEPLLGAFPLDRSAQHSPDDTPVLLRGLFRAPLPRAATGTPTGTPAGLGEGFAALSAAERYGELLTLVRGHTAAVLAHTSADAIDPEQAFRDIGFDSLTAVELRNRLNTATGLRLPTTITFEHPTPQDLARHLTERLEAPQAGPAVPASAAGRDATLADRFHQLCRDEHTSDALELLREAAGRLPTYDVSEAEATAPACVILSDGAEEPRLICIPSPFLPGDPTQYIPLGQHLPTRRVSACHLPGHQPAEALPASRDALIGALAHAVLRSADGHPYILLGHSAGGWLAHETAGHLTHSPEQPAGLILIDTGTPDQLTTQPLDDLLTFAHQRTHSTPADASVLTGMAHYVGLFTHWTPQPLQVPTHLITATNPTHGRTSGWHLPHTTAQSEGDHYSMMNQHAATTAEAVETWLADLHAPPR